VCPTITEDEASPYTYFRLPRVHKQFEIFYSFSFKRSITGLPPNTKGKKSINVATSGKQMAIFEEKIEALKCKTQALKIKALDHGTCTEIARDLGNVFFIPCVIQTFRPCKINTLQQASSVSS
jgi:hypothetical protein